MLIGLFPCCLANPFAWFCKSTLYR